MRTIAITGAASGIGAATARHLADRGDRVIGIDLDGTDVSADLSTEEGRRRAAEEVHERSGGRLDGLVTSAGLSAPSPATVAVNYFGTTRLVTALQPALAASPTPRVALIASFEATHAGDDTLVEACLADDEDAALDRARTLLDGGDPGAGYVLYPASKHALVRWMRRTCIAPGWADAGIAINAVGPGVVETPMTHDLLADEQMAELADQAVPMPLNGHARAEDLAVVLGWLVDPDNRHMTGQVLFVDGGADATRRGDLAW